MATQFYNFHNLTTTFKKIDHTQNIFIDNFKDEK